MSTHPEQSCAGCGIYHTHYHYVLEERRKQRLLELLKEEHRIIILLEAVRGEIKNLKIEYGVPLFD